MVIAVDETGDDLGVMLWQHGAHLNTLWEGRCRRQRRGKIKSHLQGGESGVIAFV